MINQITRNAEKRLNNKEEEEKKSTSIVISVIRRVLILLGRLRSIRFIPRLLIESRIQRRIRHRIAIRNSGPSRTGNSRNVWHAVVIFMVIVVAVVDCGVVMMGWLRFVFEPIIVIWVGCHVVTGIVVLGDRMAMRVLRFLGSYCAKSIIRICAMAGWILCWAQSAARQRGDAALSAVVQLDIFVAVAHRADSIEVEAVAARDNVEDDVQKGHGERDDDKGEERLVQSTHHDSGRCSPVAGVAGDADGSLHAIPE